MARFQRIRENCSAKNDSKDHTLSVYIGFPHISDGGVILMLLKGCISPRYVQIRRVKGQCDIKTILVRLVSVLTHFVKDTPLSIFILGQI